MGSRPPLILKDLVSGEPPSAMAVQNSASLLFLPFGLIPSISPVSVEQLSLFDS